jgi:hypothetical protein
MLSHVRYTAFVSITVIKKKNFFPGIKKKKKKNYKD